jgi:hypothetical protein
MMQNNSLDLPARLGSAPADTVKVARLAAETGLSRCSRPKAAR